MVRFFRRKKDAPAEPVEAPERPEEPAAAEPVEAGEAPRGVEDAVEKTRRTWFSRIGGMFRRGLGDELWDELEEALIAADAGAETALKLLEGVRERVKDEGIRDPEQAQEVLKEALVSILEVDAEQSGTLWCDSDGSFRDPLRVAVAEHRNGGCDLPKPAVILVVGVNGTGKTTSIGKLAHAYSRAGRKVVLAAADTFRAAAIDQLKQWGERAGVDVVAHQQGADPGAVVFDSLAAAQSRGADVLIIDTAGRLHTKINLMEEMRKVHRIIQRQYPDAPHEVLLVLDATSGQNALHQSKYFTEALGVTSILLAKLDGTAKGGVIFGVCDQLRIPVRFVGTGENVDDLAPFEPKRFVDALFA